MVVKGRGRAATATALPTRAERRAVGRALRDKVPREAHAGWTPPARRRDPIDILIESSKGRLAQLVPIRYGRMMRSPFTFYRGAAAIMAADLAATPCTGIRVQACGDCHLLNFGGFATPERRILFDINDFDETLPAPCEWDVKRLAASFVVAARSNGFGRADARDVTLHCLQSYREQIERHAEMGALETWYERIEIDTLIALARRKKMKKFIRQQVEKAARSVVEHDFPKLTEGRSGRARIRDNPPLIFHQSRWESGKYDQIVQEAFARYRDTLPDDLKALIDRYEITDIAAKVVGVGSVGTRCGILLLMAASDDVMFLQVKEARVSVLEPYAGASAYANRGRRVAEGQRLMQAASDMFLGWTKGELGRHFYIRQLRDIKIKPMIELMDPQAMARYGEWCGWALARAHAKSGDAAMIAGYLGNSDAFDTALVRFAEDYADQNERDHRALLEAIRDDRLDVLREE
jgi:uncharacterized protein (DUF2252 family)